LEIRIKPDSDNPKPHGANRPEKDIPPRSHSVTRDKGRPDIRKNIPTCLSFPEGNQKRGNKESTKNTAKNSGIFVLDIFNKSCKIRCGLHFSQSFKKEKKMKKLITVFALVILCLGVTSCNETIYTNINDVPNGVVVHYRPCYFHGFDKNGHDYCDYEGGWVKE